MSSQFSSPIGISSLLFMIFGILFAVLGIIFLLIYQNQSKPWYIWLFLIVGLVFGIIGGILLSITLAKECKPVKVIDVK